MTATKPNGFKTALRYLIPLLVIPALVMIGAFLFSAERYLIISLGVAVLSLLLFYTGIEEKKIGSRRMVLTAIFTALSVVGRFIPVFKPVTALTVIAAVYLGAESGFLVGSLSALISNIYFGQGPWTPFQMLAWGLIGLFAGYLSAPLKKHRWALLCYGVLSGVFFSFVMDIWTVLWYNGGFSLELYLAALVSAIPYTVVYAVSNFIFLFFLAKPMGQKLERVKIKYGV
ncbi:MAG: ECF transporter S component [Ruminococcus sp.]|nr:ECF transporter S component [Ruminococcus sp.]